MRHPDISANCFTGFHAGCKFDRCGCLCHKREDIYREPPPYKAIPAYQEEPMGNRETVYNFFLFEDEDEFIRKIGVVAHSIVGNDRSKIRFLQEKVNTDCKACRTFPVPQGCYVQMSDGEMMRGVIRRGLFNDLIRQNKHWAVLEEIFRELKAPIEPLFVTTYIRDGSPQIEAVGHFGKLRD